MVKLYKILGVAHLGLSVVLLFIGLYSNLPTDYNVRVLILSVYGLVLGKYLMEDKNV